MPESCIATLSPARVGPVAELARSLPWRPGATSPRPLAAATDLRVEDVRVERRAANLALGTTSSLASVRARVDLAARSLDRRPAASRSMHVRHVGAAPALHRRRPAARPGHVLRVVAVGALRRGSRTVRT